MSQNDDLIALCSSACRAAARTASADVQIWRNAETPRAPTRTELWTNWDMRPWRQRFVERRRQRGVSMSHSRLPPITLCDHTTILAFCCKSSSHLAIRPLTAQLLISLMSPPAICTAACAAAFCRSLDPVCVAPALQ
ncbi:hypothetical protein CC85DRAFT_175463 [Cutaneotrichosporon oleaginosum]|uniref:Uncharacterized protein n=1 Tax=Cutaneotrichosporon oleaginosum TaxID=879819 RepID=A0A0J0XFL5_9TREE|nr:uncharacterized protein CC85DRAFT_175463 [Cutaneotrichosporon oleaginosum]KLT39885.1 hypothetical protein CC85DRAFT_175463 [Cutaneotrichosporon oleaginosum]TXT14207.1 hypothetical protein COLE_00400 [Cutaneotrichosporon oleaginosum]